MQKRAKTSKMRDSDKKHRVEGGETQASKQRGRGEKKERKIKGEDGNMCIAQMHL